MMNEQTILAASSTVSSLESEAVSDSNFRSIDGSNNNLINAEWGSTEEQLLRLSFAAYADGISEPRGGNPSVLPNPRNISNIVVNQTELTPNTMHITDWFWQWGQFIDHDLDLTEAATPTEPFNIPIPTGEPLFDPFGTGTQQIPLNRSIFDPATGTDASNPRQQINEITAYLDASMVYGSDEAQAELLRTDDGTGRLRVSVGENGEVLLPTNGLSQFVAGDGRVNEQSGLTAAHTLFVREHNRRVEELTVRLDGGETGLVTLFNESGLDRGDFLYESARRIVGAEIQVITFNEFLPILIGETTLGEYDGYDATVNAGISTEFSTAAFRLGHTLLSPNLLQVEADGTVDKIALRDAFFNPSIVAEDGVDSLFQGLASQVAQELDAHIVDDVRSFLFGPPGAGGLDLASLNIQRGRDHGLPAYNEVRSALGLGAVTNVTEITSDVALQDALLAAYGDVNAIDLWVGGLAEDAAAGAMVGETFQAILADQFDRLRDGDRFWYEGDAYLDILAPDIDTVTLADIILANSDVASIQDNVFLRNAIVDAPGLSSNLEGTAGDDFIDAGDGNDIVAGSTGNDEILGGDGDDVLRGDKNSRRSGTGVDGGNDTLRGGAGSDRLGGKAGDDLLYGDEGNDSLWGDDGEDTLIGGAGNDYLSGDEYNTRTDDLFVLALGAGTDTIADFGKGSDRLGLSAGLTFGDLSITQMGGNAAIAVGSETLAILNGVAASTLTADAFVLV